MPGLSFNPNEYRFGGAGGQEADDEITGSRTHYTAEYWEYDSRIGRRWNIGPVDKPWMSSYHAFSNNPIWNIDPNGAEDTRYEDEEGNLIAETDDGNDMTVKVSQEDQKMFEFALSKTTKEEQSKIDWNAQWVSYFYNKNPGSVTQPYSTESTDNYGIFQSSSNEAKANHPFLSAAHDIAIDLLNGTAIGALDNAIAMSADDNLTTSDKVHAWIPLLLTSKGGKRSGRIAPTKLRVGNQIDIKAFTKQGNRLVHSKSKGYYLERDTKKGQAHAGSHYKLKNKQGERLFKVGQDGTILRD